MTKRFEGPFTESQADALARAFDRLWWRTMQVVITLFIGVALGYAWGLHQISNTSHISVSALHKADRLNRQLAKASAESAHQSAVFAYTTCRGQQEVQVNLHDLVHIAIPKHLEGRSPEVQANINQLYDVLKARHVLDIPKCPKPPKGVVDK